ncbi:glycosyltransferase family 25 protein [Devosia sp.]|uniref:glycosyltransferase family 25 protein n=1 Tax=Devosia sp. TaxID=1871048 RepID=UPI0035B40273
MLPIYYVNLASRPDRRDFMDAQFARVGLAARRIEAVTPATIAQEIVERHCGARRPDQFSPLQLACNLSHQAAWRAFLADGGSHGAFLEDDGVLSERLPAFLRELASGFPPGVDIVRFETALRPVRLGSRPLHLGRFELRRMLGGDIGTCGYAMTRSMTERLLADPRLNDQVIDAYLFSRSGPLIHLHRVLQLVPALTVQLAMLDGTLTTGVGASDLELARTMVWRSRPASRRHRLAQNIRQAALDARYFATDLRGLLGSRTIVPFEP